MVSLIDGFEFDVLFAVAGVADIGAANQSFGNGLVVSLSTSSFRSLSNWEIRLMESRVSRMTSMIGM